MRVGGSGCVRAKGAERVNVSVARSSGKVWRMVAGNNTIVVLFSLRKSLFDLGRRCKRSLPAGSWRACCSSVCFVDAAQTRKKQQIDPHGNLSPLPRLLRTPQCEVLCARQPTKDHVNHNVWAFAAESG